MSDTTPNVTIEAVLVALDQLRRDHEQLIEDVQAELADKASASLHAAREVLRMTEVQRRVHGFANRLTGVMADCSYLKEQAAAEKKP